jgi:PAS domain S-box-containing protein
MSAGEKEVLTSVKRSLFRHPAAIAAGGAALGALLVVNGVAVYRGTDAPWLLGTAIVADIIAVGIGVLIATREVLVADERSEATQARLAAIVDSAMDAVITVDERQSIVLFNRAAEQVFRCQRAEALGAPLERFIPQRFRSAHRGHIERFAQTGVTGRRMGDVTTLWALRANGEEFPIEASISQAGTAGQRFFTVILRDISLRMQTEKDSERMRSALDSAQARLAAIVDSAMDAVLTVDAEQKIVLFNRAAEQLFGVPRNEALGAPLERFIPQRFRGAHRGHIERFGQTGVTSRRMGDVTTLWALRADGSEVPIEASISQATDGGQRYFTVILRDITVRKQAEDALRASERELRELSARVFESREEEKARIARELHDELGQMLTALKMDLAWMTERLPGGRDPLSEKAEEMRVMLDRTVTATRRISADLRPLMLDDLGLAEAAGWLVQEFAKRSGVACDFRLSAPEAMQDAPKNVANAVYRALQESLTNIARHSGAKNAWVVVAVQDGAILLEVEDDGRGIGAGDLAKVRSLGLKGMRERFLYIGGALEISAAPRGGTRLRIRAPLQSVPPTSRENA